MSVLVVLLGACAGCGSAPKPPPPPPPPAKPVIVKSENDFHLFDNNGVFVWVRNDGDEGPVLVTVNWSETTSHFERGESGLEKKAREIFTRETEPPPREVHKEHYLGSWNATRRLKKGETYQFTIELPGHSRSTGGLSVTACGLPDDIHVDYDKAIANLTEAIGLDPKDAKLYLNRGEIYLGKGEHYLGDYDKAIADFNEAIRLKPDYADAYNFRGAAFVGKDEHDKAIADFNEAIRLNPKDAEAYANRGVAYLRKGENGKADKDFAQSRAIKDNPK